MNIPTRLLFNPRCSRGKQAVQAEFACQHVQLETASQQINPEAQMFSKYQGSKKKKNLY